MSCWLLVVWASDPDLRTHPPNRNNNARKLKLNIVSVVSPVPSLVLLTFFLYEMFSTSLSVTEPLMPTAGLHTRDCIWPFPIYPEVALSTVLAFPTHASYTSALEFSRLPTGSFAIMLRGLSPNVSCHMSLCRYSLRPMRKEAVRTYGIPFDSFVCVSSNCMANQGHRTYKQKSCTAIA